MSTSEHKLQTAKNLPAPIPGVQITIPIDLYPAYMQLHQLEPKEYKEQEEILIVTRPASTKFESRAR